MAAFTSGGHESRWIPSFTSFETGCQPRASVKRFRLSLEQVYGAIAFYLGHEVQVTASMQNADRAWSEFDATHPVPDSIRERLREARNGLNMRRER